MRRLETHSYVTLRSREDIGMKGYEVVASHGDWTHKETRSRDLVVTLAQISNDIPCYMDSICSPSTRSKCWRLLVSTVSP
jgi:hypothetical protein